MQKTLIFLGVCFAKTADIETPLKLMRKLHQQVMALLRTETGTDAFTQRERLFETTLFELSQQSVDGKENSSEDARKITSWFETIYLVRDSQLCLCLKPIESL